MDARQSPQRFVLDQVHCLEELWTKVRDGDTDGIHRARVATRRIRAALPLVRNVDPAISKTFRCIGRQLGRVRELDVTSELLAALQSRVPHASAAIGALRQEVERERQARRRRLIKAVDGINMFRLGRGIAAASNGVAGLANLWHPWPTAVRAELRRRADDLESEIRRASGVYMPKRTHRVRIALKKLRYVLELATVTGVSSDPQSLSALKRAQDILGDLHDLQVLTKTAQGTTVKGTAFSHERAILEAVVAVESSRLHGRYLRRRDQLMEVCRVCAGVVDTGPLKRPRPVRVTMQAGLAGACLALWYVERRRDSGRSTDDIETSPRAALPAPVAAGVEYGSLSHKPVN